METDGDRKLLVALTMGLGLVVISLLAMRPPAELVFPSCPLHWVTGLHCPGCGSLRATHFLMQGEWQAALQHNLLAVVMIPLLVWLFIGEFVTAFGRRLPMRVQLPGSATWLLLVVILLFGVMRNLPAKPFSLLAPPPAAAQQLDSSS